MQNRIIKLFLRGAISAGFLSAVADRFGLWAANNSTWGNWDAFLEYTGLINPWFPQKIIPGIGALATAAEIILALFLILGFKTALAAKLSGYLLFLFGLVMSFSTGVKGALDYSVFAAAAGALALSTIKEKHLELDILLEKKSKIK